MFSIRILPHHQNTGAFFVAVLKKVGPFTSKEKRNETDNKGAEKADLSKGDIDDRYVFYI